jgi:hypothetical protein
MKKTTDPDVFVEEDKDEESDYLIADEEKYIEKEEVVKGFIDDEEGEETY